MTLEQLEHIIRAAAVIADDDELIIIGSQAILGAYPRAPQDLLVSAEADLYPKNHPERADLIDGSIGELSPFHDTFGYYAQGVSPSTAQLPAGWEQRLICINSPGTRGATGWCLHPDDLALAKLAAGREKDLRFVADMSKHGEGGGDASTGRTATGVPRPASSLAGQSGSVWTRRRDVPLAQLAVAWSGSLFRRKSTTERIC